MPNAILEGDAKFSHSWQRPSAPLSDKRIAKASVNSFRECLPDKSYESIDGEAAMSLDRCPACRVSTVRMPFLVHVAARVCQDGDCGIAREEADTSIRNLH